MATSHTFHSQGSIHIHHVNVTTCAHKTHLFCMMSEYWDSFSACHAIGKQPCTIWISLRHMLLSCAIPYGATVAMNVMIWANKCLLERWTICDRSLKWLVCFDIWFLRGSTGPLCSGYNLIHLASVYFLHMLVWALTLCKTAVQWYQ